MKKILSMILAATLLLGLFGCAASDPENTTGEGETAQNDKVILLNDFENFRDDFAPCYVDGCFGRVTLNTDPAYVTSGSGSAKLELIYEEYIAKATGNGRFGIALNYERRGEDYSDLTDKVMISFDVINTADKDLPVTLELSTTGATAATRSATIKPGRSTVNYPVDRQALSFGYELNAFYCLTITFDTELYKDAPVTLYLDNVKIYRDDKPFEEPEYTFAPGEVEFFDSPWQFYTTGIALSHVGTPFKPTLTLNTDPRYATSGNSLKVSFVGNDGSVAPDNWAYEIVQVGRKLFEPSGLTKMGAGKKFEMDIYTDEITPLRLFVYIVDKNGDSMAVHRWVNVSSAGKTTVSFTAADIMLGNMTVTGPAVTSGCESVTTASVISNIDRIDIYFEVTRSMNRTYNIYIDDLRMVDAT